MALKTIHSTNVTFMDTTDDRKLSVYISSNHPSSQLFNTNTNKYTPDWSTTNLQLSAEVYLDSKDVTSDSQTIIGWYTKIGATETLIGTGASFTISTNDLAVNPIITYVCKAEYQNVNATSQQTFTRVDTGVDGTSVQIKATATSVSPVEGTDYYTITYNGGNVTSAELNDAYMYNGDLYVCVDVQDGVDYFLNVGRIQGPAGESAKNIILSGSAQVFKVSKTNEYTPTTISVAAHALNTSVTEWAYSTDGGKTFSAINIPVGVVRDENIVTITGSALVSNSLVIKASDSTVEDVFTVYKAFDGTDGTLGGQGESASVAFLTNENISFAANANGQTYGTAITTNVVAYNGVEKVLPTIGTILSAALPDGITVTVDQEATALADKEVVLLITVAPDAILGSALSTNGEISIPVISPVSTNLKLNWSKINTGSVGEPGADAVTFQIYSTNGYALSTNTPTVTLQTFAYIGDSEITAGAKYQWYAYNDGWSAISGATLAYLDVSRNDVSFSKSYMCKMLFNNTEYTSVATIDDKNDENKVFTTKPSAYTAGDLWIVGADYKPSGVEIGTLLRAEHTNVSYADNDWITATKYDEKIAQLKSDIDNYNQYFSFDSTNGLKIRARNANGTESKFSTSLTNERLAFNYGDQAVAYINGTKMNIKEAVIESPLTVTGKYSGSTMQQAPIINIGKFSIVVESNGSLSIVANT